MESLRKPESEAKYNEWRRTHKDSGCALCKKVALLEFAFWRIVENQFSYDRIAKIHHMLVPRRHVTEKQLSVEEITELRILKEKCVGQNYDYILEATQSVKTIPDHFHLHLIVVKENTG